MVQQLQQTLVVEQLFRTQYKWRVWFAWYPVRITIITKYEEIHDEIIELSNREWRWLSCVSYRTRYPFIDRGAPYEYGPATNALTQPRSPRYGK
jgi:hypothetical protein